MEVAQPGRQHEPSAVDPLGGRIGLPRDDATDDGQVPDLIGPGSRVDDSGADHGEGGGRIGQAPEDLLAHAAPAMRARTAIRTGTPFST